MSRYLDISCPQSARSPSRRCNIPCQRCSLSIHHMSRSSQPPRHQDLELPFHKLSIVGQKSTIPCQSCTIQPRGSSRVSSPRRIVQGNTHSAIPLPKSQTSPQVSFPIPPTPTPLPLPLLQPPSPLKSKNGSITTLTSAYASSTLLKNGKLGLTRQVRSWFEIMAM